MTNSVDEILAHIRQRVARGEPIEGHGGVQGTHGILLPGPASAAALDSAERSLGLRLPVLLRRLYAEIANGGFGPGYGLLGVPPEGATDDLGKNLVSLYQTYREADDPHWTWPVGLVPVAHLGCAMYACVNAATQPAGVIWFEPNGHELGTPWDASFIPLADSLETWLQTWLDGRDLVMEAAGEPEEGV